jgi:hypothetical protein
MVGLKDVTGAVKWAWDNRAGIKVALAAFRRWLRHSKLLIIGPGGTGKSTLARMLSGEFDWLRDSPWRYDEDVGVKRFRLRADPAAEIVVMPGQEHRRPASWAGVGKDLAKGAYHGVILVSANGYHSLSGISYKDHELHEPGMDKDVFLRKYLEAKRADEVGCLKHLLPFLKECPRKIWLVSAITKQDLWRRDKSAAEKWYSDGEYGDLVRELIVSKGTTFRHELHPLSLVIGKFVAAPDEVLAKNIRGYDQRDQVESVRRLFEVIDGVRLWASEK